MVGQKNKPNYTSSRSFCLDWHQYLCLRLCFLFENRFLLWLACPCRVMGAMLSSNPLCSFFLVNLKKLHITSLLGSNTNRGLRGCFCHAGSGFVWYSSLTMHEWLAWRIYNEEYFPYLKHSILPLKEWDMILFVNNWSIPSAIHHVKV